MKKIDKKARVIITEQEQMQEVRECFNELITNYQSKFELNLQKYLNDYRREIQVYVGEREKQVAELFLDNKDSYIHDFEQVVVAKKNKEFSLFTRDLQLQKNKMLTDLESCNENLIKEFCNSVKAFSSENKQKLGDYFFSEKNRLVYEAREVIESFRKQLQVGSAEVLEESLETIQVLISKQRELAKSEIDSMKIFKLKEFKNNLESELESSDKIFQKSILESASDEVFRFNSKLDGISIQVLEKTSDAMENSSAETKKQFNNFSSRRLEELKDDFIENLSDAFNEFSLKTSQKGEIAEQVVSEKIIEKKEMFIGELERISNSTKTEINTFVGSLKEQTHKELEVINDNSLDSLKELLEEEGNVIYQEFSAVSEKLRGERFDELAKMSLELKESYVEDYSKKLRVEKENVLKEVESTFSGKSFKVLNEFIYSVKQVGSEQEKRISSHLKKAVEVNQLSFTDRVDELIARKGVEFISKLDSEKTRCFERMSNLHLEHIEKQISHNVNLLQETKQEIYQEFLENKTIVLSELEFIREELKSRFKSQTEKVIDDQVLSFAQKCQNESYKLLEQAEEVLSNKIKKQLAGCERKVEAQMAIVRHEAEEVTNKISSLGKVKLESFSKGITDLLERSLGAIANETNVKIKRFDSELQSRGEKKIEHLSHEINNKVAQVKSLFHSLQEQEQQKYLSLLSKCSSRFLESKTEEFKAKIQNTFEQASRAANLRVKQDLANSEKDYKGRLLESESVSFEEYRVKVNKLGNDKSLLFSNNVGQVYNTYKARVKEVTRKSTLGYENTLMKFNDKFCESLNNQTSINKKNNYKELQEESQKIIENSLQSISLKGEEIGGEHKDRLLELNQKVLSHSKSHMLKNFESEVDRFSAKVNSIGDYVSRGTKKNLKESLEKVRDEYQVLHTHADLMFKKRIKKYSVYLEKKMKSEYEKSLREMGASIEKKHQQSKREIFLELTANAQNVIEATDREILDRAKKYHQQVVKSLMQVEKRSEQKMQVLESRIDRKIRYVENRVKQDGESHKIPRLPVSAS